MPEPIPTEAEVQISPPREGLDWDLALKSIVEENLRLRKEIMEIKGMAGGARGFGGQQPGQLLALPGPSGGFGGGGEAHQHGPPAVLAEGAAVHGSTNRELMEG